MLRSGGGADAAAGVRAGLILFVRENTLMAIPVDAGSAQIGGDVFPVADGVSVTSNATAPSLFRIMAYYFTPRAAS